MQYIAQYCIYSRVMPPRAALATWKYDGEDAERAGEEQSGKQGDWLCHAQER